MRTLFLSLAGAIMLLGASFAKSQTITNYTTTDGLSDNFISGGVAVDNNDVKWFGTASGVTKLEGTTWTTYTTADGLIDNYVICIAVDMSNNIWVGTNSGVSKFNGSTWTSYTTTDGLADNAVTYIYCDISGAVWFATGVGLTKFSAGTWTTYTTSSGLASETISYITEDGSGSLWVGTQMGGFSKWNGSGFTSFQVADEDSLLSDNVFAIAVSPSGNAFIGSWSGISEVSTAGIWVENFRIGDGLYNNFVRDMKVKNNGTLWVGCFADYNSDGGVSCYANSTWTSWGVAEGLADNQVIRIALDQSDNVWVATGNGVSKISGASGIAEESGMQISVSPNPASDVVYINAKQIASQVNLLNTSGQLVMSRVPTANSFTMDVNTLPQGVYILQMIFDNQISTQKILIK
jgi:ligand-binding sensor domain-containing protein